MNVVFDTRFQTDLKIVARYQPNIVYELRELIDAINELGEIPAVYNSHLLIQPRGNYTGYWELHLQEGKFDIVVIYTHTSSRATIRFIRIGSHKDLFQGKML